MIPSKRKIVIFLGTTIFLKEYVGILLINKRDTLTNVIGTNKL